jgi:hypothetical protein
MSSYPSSSPDLNVAAASVTTPTDRVRWPAIFAGLFAALSTLVVLAVLGAAVAGSTWDPGDSARTFGIGAGIWAAVSALIAFFIGGFLASRTAAVRGHNNGTLNGAMVWVVAIPLILWMLMGGINSLMRTTADSISAGAQAASARENVNRNDANRTPDDRAAYAASRTDAAGGSTNRSGADRTTGDRATDDRSTTAGDRDADRTSARTDERDRTDAERDADRADARPRNEDRARTASSVDLRATTQRITQDAGDPQKQEEAADKTAKSAWGTLVSLLLGLAAAAAGGYLGSRDRRFGHREHDRDRYRDDDRPRPSTSGATIVTPSGPSTVDRP